MLSGQPTVADLCRVTGYTRHQVHSLVRLALPGRSSKGERFAREFRHQDLIVIAALAELETKFGIDRRHLALVAKRLPQVLALPREPNPAARLIVTFEPPKITYVDEPTTVLEGVVMPLRPVFDRVDSHVFASSAGGQPLLQLGPAPLRTAGKRSSA